MFQAGAVSEWTNDSQRFLLEHFDTIQNYPSHIYHSALPLSPPPSWLHKCYSAGIPPMVKVVKGLLAEWGVCSYTVLLDSSPLALSCHNNVIAVGTGGGNIIIFNAITGSQTAVLYWHEEEVYSLIFSSDGTLLVSGGNDYIVILWDVQTGGVVKAFHGHDDRIWSVSISADSTRIASGSYDKTIRLWDIQTGDCYHTIQQQYGVPHICFSPTDSQILFSICNKQVLQWDTDGHQIQPPFDGDYIDFSSDGTKFVLCHEGVAIVQNSKSGVIVAKLQVTNGTIEHCCFSPDGRLVAGAANSTAYIWNITKLGPHLVGTFVGHTKSITSLAFSSPSSLITASLDGSVKVWQICAPSTDPIITDLNPTSITSAPIQSITLQAKDGITITSDSDGMIKIWDILTGLCKVSFQTPAKGTGCRDAQLICGRLICIWHIDDKIYMWDTEKGEWGVIPLQVVVCDLKVSGDKSKIFCLDFDSIRAYSIQTGELVGGVEIDFTLDERFLIVDSSRVWLYSPDLGYEGWDFGIPSSLPVQLPDVSPHRPHPNGALSWDIGLSRVKDQATGKVVFQLSRRFTKPVDVQWNGQYLVVCYPLNEVLIIDFSYFLLQ